MILSLQERFKLRMRAIQLATKMTRYGIPIHEVNRENLREPAARKLEIETANLQEAALALGWNLTEAVFAEWVVSETEKRKDGKAAKIRIYKNEPVHFNPNSGDHWHRLLCEQYGMSPLAYTETGKACWDEKVMEELKSHRDDKVASVARLGKTVKDIIYELSHFITGLPVWPDGRIHPYWHAEGAVTCRWTSDGPNAQNIPRYLRGIISALRCAHCNRNGWVFETDFSQQEPRLMALISGEPAMIDAYRRGKDIYRTVGAPMFGCTYDGLTDEQRQAMKTCLLTMCYGGSIPTQYSRFQADEKLRTIMTYKRVEAMNKRFFSEFGRIKKYHYAMEDAARSGKIVCPLGGHELHTFGQVDPQVVYNFPIQGSGAHQTRDALLEYDAGCDWQVTQILGNQHDAISVGTLAEDPTEEVLRLRKAMEKEWTINGNTLRFATETKISSESLGQAIELKNDSSFKGGNWRSLAQAVQPQPSCRFCGGA